MKQTANPAETADIRETLGIDGPGARRQGRRRWLLGGAAVVVAAVFIFLAWRGGRERNAVTYRTEEVRRGSLTVTVTATGELEPVNQVEVGTEISGIVETVAVDYNAPVRLGQLLAKINTDKLEAQVLQARAALEVAEARLLESQATVLEASNELARLRHVRELSDGKVPSQHDLDAAEAKRKRAEAEEVIARAQITEARATLEAIETDLAKATIRAPIDGIVLNRQVEIGQTVAATFQTPVLFTLAEDLTRMELAVDVDEADVGRVAVGQRATFTVDAYPDRNFEARVVEVRFAPETVEGVVTYETLLSVDNTDLLLRPGMTATADIIVETVDDAVLVANAALRFTPPEPEIRPRRIGGILPPPPGASVRQPAEVPDAGASQRVWVLREGKPVPIELIVGATDGEMTEVASGEVEPGLELLVDFDGGED